MLISWSLINFLRVTRAFKAFMVKLKQAGKGSVKHKKAISKEDSWRYDKDFGFRCTWYYNTVRPTKSSIHGSNDLLLPIEVVKIFVTWKQKILLFKQMSKIWTTLHTETCLQRTDVKLEDDEEWSGFMYDIPGSLRCPVTSFLAYQVCPKSFTWLFMATT